MPYRLTCTNGHHLLVAKVIPGGQVHCPKCKEPMLLRSEDEAGTEDKPVATEQRRRKLLATIKLPAVSGWTTALILFASFLVSALAIPMTLSLPRWVAAEVVVGVWWLIWIVTLTWLLNNRAIIGDDIRLHEPRGPFGYGVYRSDWLPFDPGCLLIGEWGCLIPFVLAVLLPGLVWLVIEVAIPFLAVVLFGTIRGMLACVVNDRHQCQGHLGRSLGWAALWATAYTAPPALLILWIHWCIKAPLA